MAPSAFLGLGGLEPPTPRLSSVCSNQLSYRPPSVRPGPRTSYPISVISKSKEEVRTLKAKQQARASKHCENIDLVRPRDFSRWIDAHLRRDGSLRGLLRKEVIQPQVPLRLPCYDFTPVTSHSLGGYLLAVSMPTSGATDSHGVTGGVYKARERIHRSVLIYDY